MKKTVAVVIPVYKEKLNNFEIISLRQLIKILGKYTIYIVAPKQINLDEYEKYFITNSKFKTIFFDKKYFTNRKTYSNLLVSKHFYSQFINYKYILIYQLDAFVFRDELTEWCEKGYDYIGAPWFEGYSSATQKSKFIGVGNGGFSLRNVKSSLRYINEHKLIEISNNLEHYNLKGFVRYSYTKFLLPLINKKPAKQIAEFYGHEDHLWCTITPEAIKIHNKKTFPSALILKLFIKGIKIADKNKAIEFAFEYLPKYLYDMNNKQLPFGCHAWQNNLDFWRPFFKDLGYII